MVVFGPVDSMAALELGAIDKLILYEELNLRRVIVEHSVSKEKKILYLKPDQVDNPKHFVDDKGLELIVIDKETVLIEWLIDHYKDYGANLEIISDRSQEGF